MFIYLFVLTKEEENMDKLFMNANMDDNLEIEIEVNAEGAIIEAPEVIVDETTEKTEVLTNDKSTDLIDLAELGIEDTESKDEDSEKIDPLLGLDEKEKSPSSEDIKEKGDKPAVSLEQSSLFNSFASILTDEGVLSATEEELKDVNNAEAFVNLIKETVKKNELSDLNDKQRKAVEAFRSGVPAQEYVESANQLDVLNSITDDHIQADNEESLKLRQDLIVENMISKGFAEAKAVKYAQMHVDAGSDKEEASESHKSLLAGATIDIDARKKDQENKATAKEAKKVAYQTELKKSVETQDIIPGMKLNTSMRESIYKSMTTPAHTNNDGRAYDAVMTEWTKDQGYKMRVHALHVLTDGFKDFTPLYGGKQKTKSSIEKLDELAASGNILSTGKVGGQTPNVDLGKVKSFLDSLPDPNNY